MGFTTIEFIVGVTLNDTWWNVYREKLEKMSPDLYNEDTREDARSEFLSDILTFKGIMGLDAGVDAYVLPRCDATPDADLVLGIPYTVETASWNAREKRMVPHENGKGLLPPRASTLRHRGSDWLDLDLITELRSRVASFLEGHPDLKPLITGDIKLHVVPNGCYCCS
jgi:hypothetical protein